MPQTLPAVHTSNDLTMCLKDAAACRECCGKLVEVRAKASSRAVGHVGMTLSAAQLCEFRLFDRPLLASGA